MGTVYRTYLTTARGLEPAMGYYGLLDRTPIGRNEEGDQVSGCAATTSTRTPSRRLLPDNEDQDRFRTRARKAGVPAVARHARNDDSQASHLTPSWVR
jgi:hypothetical protein